MHNLPRRRLWCRRNQMVRRLRHGVGHGRLQERDSVPNLRLHLLRYSARLLQSRLCWTVQRSVHQGSRKSSHFLSHQSRRFWDGLVCRLRHLVGNFWLQEYPPAPQLRHPALQDRAGVLQGCLWRTDERGVRPRSPKSSHQESLKSPTQKPTSLTSTCSVLVTTYSYDASNIDSMFLTGLMWK